MAERLIEILIPGHAAAEIRGVIEGVGPHWIWQQTAGDTTELRVILAAESVEGVLDALEGLLEDSGGRAIVLPVEASLPRTPDEEATLDAQGAAPAPAAKAPGRISRQELYEDLSEFSKATPTFFVMTALAVVVAAIGITRDSPAITIGAMVIAPLLGPNMALALATTLADKPLGLRSLKTNLAGVTTAVLVAVLAGLVWEVDVGVAEISSRTSISPGEILLALATGVAGAMAVTRGLPTSLVGVMVAVALLPPVVIATMLCVQGHFREAANATLLLATNVICVNLSGVATFYVQGVRPGTWWEAESSRRATRAAIAIWTGLLALIAVLILVSQRYTTP